MSYTNIDKSTDYFNTKLISGNGGTQSITGVGHQPDFTWIKSRSRVDPHSLTDSVRGVASQLDSSLTSAPTTHSDAITSFDSDGFSLGSQADVNRSGTTFVSWNWKANGAGSANTDGSLNSTVSVNTTAGFSIVKYTAGSSSAVSTIGHGLNSVPKMIMVKGIDSNSTPDQWMVYHEALGNTKRIKLNSTDAAATGSGYWNNTTPTSSLFTVGNSSEGNSGNGLYITYCFAEKTGYSKFGSYVGNGDSDGTFVYTGFKPAFMMVKRTDGAQPWVMTDSTRSTYNITSHFLSAESSDAEASYTYFDILSNGFKCRNSSNYVNESNGTYIYMAFAEAPLVGTNNVPCTAR
jgi:hypothetical protein